MIFSKILATHGIIDRYRPIAAWVISCATLKYWRYSACLPFIREYSGINRCSENSEDRYFSVKTEQARLKMLLYSIYRHLYSKQTRNAWFEMHISSVVHIWSKKTKITNVCISFHLRRLPTVSNICQCFKLKAIWIWKTIFLHKPLFPLI
jgi:hypothetical protein